MVLRGLFAYRTRQRFWSDAVCKETIYSSSKWQSTTGTTCNPYLATCRQARKTAQRWGRLSGRHAAGIAGSVQDLADQSAAFDFPSALGLATTQRELFRTGRHNCTGANRSRVTAPSSHLRRPIMRLCLALFAPGIQRPYIAKSEHVRHPLYTGNRLDSVDRQVWVTCCL